MNVFAREAHPIVAAMRAFDELRARLESEIARPSVIAVTGASSVDGVEGSARGLATSFAAAGYATLLIAGASLDDGIAASFSLEQMAQAITPNVSRSVPAVASAGNIAQQRQISQRDIQHTFETLRLKFDFVVVEAEYRDASPFATSSIAAADAVLVSIRHGRRRSVVDEKLSDVLDRDAVNFLGVIALDDDAIKELRAPTAEHIEGRRLSRKSRKDEQGLARQTEVPDVVFR